MPANFLYQDLNSAIQLGFLNLEISDWLRENLNPTFQLRPYQEEAFARFFHCLDNDFPGKEHPLHLLFNMATGSGKTLIMAGLILYLYEKGYRNFLFFVNSTNIIEKTKDNFLNPLSSKFLFNEPLHIGGNQVSVTPVANFEGANDRDINICFTTIQKLHSDLTTQRENAITLASLKRYFPHLTSIREFITSEDYLGGLEITFEGDLYGLDANPTEKLAAMSGLLSEIESEMREQITEFEGTKEFRGKWVREVFKDKVLKFDANNLRVEDDSQFEHFVSSRDWFANNTIYGTSEEKDFVRMLDRFIIQLEEQYDEIYLLRNEGHFAIYNFSDGSAFQPDFALFLREKNGEISVYQLFIEPKGAHLREHDRWKEELLAEITSRFDGRRLEFNNKKYRLIGVPFYNNRDENEFREALESVLSLPDGI